MREYEQRFGKTVDEDVKICIILARAPPSVQNHWNLNWHVLKSNVLVRTMLFDCSRAQADVAASENMPMDLSMLGKGKQKGKGDKTPKRLSTSQVIASDAKLVSHEEGLLVESTPR